MTNQDRVLILGYLNAAYRRAFQEEAVKTQEFLIQLIGFLRYYLNDEIKIVRVREELNSLQAFFDLYQAGGGKVDLSLDCPAAVLEMDVPAKSFVAMARQLQDLWEAGEAPRTVRIEGCLTGDVTDILFFVKMNHPNITDKQLSVIESQIVDTFQNTAQVKLGMADDGFRVLIKFPAPIESN